MKYILAIMMLLGINNIFAQQRTYDSDVQIKIWDNSTAPHSNKLSGKMGGLEEHRVTNVSEAELFIYQAPKEVATGQAVVICPGGGYGKLSMDQEGYMIAQWYAEHGITAAVLQYRLPNGVKEVPFEDGVEALRIMRSKAAELNFDSSKVGITGFSAGGHLAAYISTMAEVENKPAFSVLFYPVITGEEGITHSGTFNNLLGRDRSAELTAVYSLENAVDANTPPAILILCDDDKTVPPISSARYYSALKSHNIEASMHIYPSGGHGWGMYESFGYGEQWKAALLDWLQR